MILSPALQMSGGTGGPYAGAFLGPLAGFLLVGAVVYFLWSAAIGRRSPSQRSASADDPMETLRERYARGEIDEETFDERARKLRER